MQWIKPLGDTKDGNVLINGWLTIGKLYAIKEMPAEDFFFTWQDLFGFYPSSSNLLNDLEHDFVVYLTRNTTNFVWWKIVTNRDDNEARKFQAAKSSLLTGFVRSKRDKRFAVWIDKILLNFCNRTIFFRLQFRLCMSVSSYWIYPRQNLTHFTRPWSDRVGWILSLHAGYKKWKISGQKLIF